MAKQSTQHKLDRVRPPRVQITYDVETGGAIEIKELPFVVGVLGDFTGSPEQPLPKLKERRCVEVTPDNFDSVLESMKPHVAFAVENKLSEDSDAGQIKVDLRFKSLEDFEPEQVARQVKPLKELLDLRTRLNDLKALRPSIAITGTSSLYSEEVPVIAIDGRKAFKSFRRVLRSNSSLSGFTCRATCSGSKSSRLLKRRSTLICPASESSLSLFSTAKAT